MTTPTTIYRAGDVVLTPFPYADQSGEKKRPVVLRSTDQVSLDTGLYIICANFKQSCWQVKDFSLRVAK